VLLAQKTSAPISRIESQPVWSSLKLAGGLQYLGIKLMDRIRRVNQIKWQVWQKGWISLIFLTLLIR
jgi:hypothetical protein